MSMIRKTFTRLNIAVLLIAVQVAIISYVFYTFIDVIPFVTFFTYLASLLLVLRLVKKDESAALRISWILIIMTLPIVGIFLYLLFGNSFPSRKIKKRLEKERSETAKFLQYGSDNEKDDFKDIRVEGCLQYLNSVASYPAFKNTETKYYPLGVLMYEDMLKELASAKKFILMEYFIIEEGKMWDGIMEILLAKAEEGVEVRLIFDDLICQQLFTDKFVSSLRDKKIKTLSFNPISSFFRPFMNNRDHRKLMLIDGHIGFTGAVNITDDSIIPSKRLGIWKDTGVLLRGDAVWSFTLMFIELWNVSCRPEEQIRDYLHYKAEKEFVSDGIVVPYGDSPVQPERVGENVYIDILNQAKNYVYIFTPFLIISEKMIYALQMAAKRGVDVRIILPGKYCWKRAIAQRVSQSYYKYLQKVGIKIYEDPRGYLHAKNFVCDDEIAVVGTVNLDYRSLYLHFECAVLLYKAESIKDMKADAIKAIAESNEVLFEEKRRADRFFVDAVIHLFAPML